MAQLLIVEDDAAFGQMIKIWLTKKGYDTQLVTTVSAARQVLIADKFDLVISDLRLPDSDGILLLQWIKERYVSINVILMTNYADIHSAVSAIKLGAFDYLEKPIRHEELHDKILLALKQSSKPTPTVNYAKIAKPEFIRGDDEVSKRLYDYMMLVAPTNMSVLITGESGTGKEYVAKFIHDNSKRKDKPFVAVDCGAISRELGASEFFGHVRGSFTSAVADKKGFFEEANGGTIFLDEIGNLPLDIQVQLLRALQERKIRPVGASKEISVDVRVLAATNENLLVAIENSRFREDLYHRINEFSLKVPSLRERGDDILIFARYFLQRASVELDKVVDAFSVDVERIFLNYSWSGNLRQMSNVIKRAVLFCRSNQISMDDLPDEMTHFEPEIQPLKRNDERSMILDALSRCNNNKSKAAKMLQIDRKTLYNKLKD